MSNVIRGQAVAVLDHRTAGAAISTPRVFGARVLRGDHVGIQRPISLSVPTVRPPQDDVVGQGEEDVAPAAPDLAAIEEAARLQGYNVGYEEGRAAAVAAAEASMAESVERLAALVSSVHETHAGFFRAAERQVVDLALQIAQKVIEREIENIPDMAVNVIRAALEEMDARTVVRVRVNPDDADLLRRRWSQIVPPSIGPDRVELQPDERVASGGAVLETTHGQVDARLDTKLAQLGNALWTFVMDEHNTVTEEDLGDA